MPYTGSLGNVYFTKSLIFSNYPFPL